MELTNIVKKVTDEIGSIERYDHINNDVLKIVKELNVLAQDLLAESKKVEDAVEHYITRFSTEDVSQQIVHVLNMGVPVTSLVNIMTIHGVMEGKHTIDVSILIMPVLMEMIALISKYS